MKIPRIACGLLALLFLGTSQAKTVPENWFESEAVVCAQPNGYQELLDSLGPIPQARLVTTTKGSHAQIQVSLFFSGEQAAASYLLGTLELDRSDADRLRAYLNRYAESFDIPIYADIGLSVFSAITIPSAGSLTVDTVMQLFSEGMSGIKTNIRAASILIADGGSIDRVISPKTRNGYAYAIVSDRYRVSIGKEVRSVILRSCIYPIEITVRKITIPDQHNPKYLVTTTDRIEQIDATTDKVDRDFQIISQDNEFLYLQSKDAPDLPIRISYRGGPFQNFRDGLWRTIYPRSTAE